MRRHKNRQALRKAFAAASLISAVLFNNNTFGAPKVQSDASQAYIDALVESHPRPPALSAVKYKERPEHEVKSYFSVPSTYMMFTLASQPPGGSRDISIEIYMNAFDKLRTGCDFASFLFDHEYLHVDQLSTPGTIRLPRRLAGEFSKLSSTTDEQLEKFRYMYGELLATDRQLDGGEYSSCLSSETRLRIEENWLHMHSALFESDYGIPGITEYFRSLFYRPFLTRYPQYAEENGNVYFIGGGERRLIKPLSDF